MARTRLSWRCRGKIVANWVTRKYLNEHFLSGEPVDHRTFSRWCREGWLAPIARKFGAQWRIDVDRMDLDAMAVAPAYRPPSPEIRQQNRSASLSDPARDAAKRLGLL